MFQIQGITFIFENCEDAIVHRSNIGKFIIEDITELVSRDGINSVSKKKVAKKLFIEIVNAKELLVSNYRTEYEGIEGDSLANRVVMHDDIVGVEIIYSDESKELIYFPWEGEYDNKHQVSELGENGTLQILIKEDNKGLVSMYDSEESYEHSLKDTSFTKGFWE